MIRAAWCCIYIFFLLTCNEAGTKQQPLARVNNEFLYPSDLSISLENNDSSQVLNAYINDWVRQKTFYQKALENLPPKQTRFDKEIRNYKESLVRYHYEKALIEQNIGSDVNEVEMEEQYEEMAANFTLPEHMVFLRYIIMDKANALAPRVEKLFVNRSDDDQLYGYASHFRGHQLDFEWLTYQKLKQLVPLKAKSPQKLVKNDPFLVIKDSLSLYLLEIKEFGLQGETPPMSFIRNELSQIVINKRKDRFLEKIRQEIYQEALKNNEIEIYN